MDIDCMVVSEETGSWRWLGSRQKDRLISLGLVVGSNSPVFWKGMEGIGDDRSDGWTTRSGKVSSWLAYW